MKNEYMNLKEIKEGGHGRVGWEEKEGGNDVIILKSQKRKELFFL